MAALTIQWEYLTGYAVATDPSSRQRAEWPPHPARVFMALAAAWFETAPGDEAGDAARQEHRDEGEALRQLERLAEPEIHAPTSDAASERSMVTFYVPVNDKAGPAAATLQSAPAMTRSKQARTFPRRYVGHQPCALRWSGVEIPNVDRDALDRLCGKVTRIGHSSSLVRMWVSDDEEPADEQSRRWIPADATASVHCRTFRPGMLDALPAQTQIPRIEAFAERAWQIEDAEREAKDAKDHGDAAAKKEANRALKTAKSEYEQQFGEKWKKSASPPPRLRPSIGLWTGYQPDGEKAPEFPCDHSHFDTDLLVLTRVEGPQLPAVSTSAVMKALRGAIQSHSPQPVPEWVSGHQPDGGPSRSADGHLALLPLPFVGGEHADGHLLGAALAFPRSVDRRERGRVLGPLLLDGESGEPCDVELRLGRLGVWTMRKRDWSDPRWLLRPETWTAAPGGATTWGSATPVVLDKFPKSRRSPDQRQAWEAEVREILTAACTRIGLPTPAQIDIDAACWHRGSPRAVAMRRRLRDGSHPNRRHTAHGDGFPPFPAKGTGAPRPQVHVFLRFRQPVVGPVLLGAGRYLGYGFFKPCGSQR